MPPFPEVEHATEEELSKIIGALETNKAPGPDEISNTTFLKLHHSNMSKLISKLFNECCAEKDVFPDVFKVAKVIPVPKQGGNQEEIDYHWMDFDQSH